MLVGRVVAADRVKVLAGVGGGGLLTAVRELLYLARAAGYAFTRADTGHRSRNRAPVID